jgi:NDP-sugar pyrophosphorylase family protein
MVRSGACIFNIRPNHRGHWKLLAGLPPPCPCWATSRFWWSMATSIAILILAVFLTAEGTQTLAHLVMVPNPAHHNGGDFSLDGARVVYANGEQTFTYSGVAVFAPSFFAEVKPGSIMKLRPLLDAAIAAGTLTGERHTGRWVDVGTPQRLAELDQELRDAELRKV